MSSVSAIICVRRKPFLSRMQAEALDRARRNGGKLYRVKGGFWTDKPATFREDMERGEAWHTKAVTITALIRRQCLVVSAWYRPRFGAPFMVAVSTKKSDDRQCRGHVRPIQLTIFDVLGES